MVIKKVKMVVVEEVKPGTMQDGLPVAPHPEIVTFEVYSDEKVDEAALVVPNDPTNRHYQEVKEWYGKKKLKPFKFKFE